MQKESFKSIRNAEMAHQRLTSSSKNVLNFVCNSALKSYECPLKDLRLEMSLVMQNTVCYI